MQSGQSLLQSVLKHIRAYWYRELFFKCIIIIIFIIRTQLFSLSIMFIQFLGSKDVCY